jgi:hypothetical protein
MRQVALFILLCAALWMTPGMRHHGAFKGSGCVVDWGYGKQWMYIATGQDPEHGLWTRD